MRLHEAKKIMRENGYRLIKEEFESLTEMTYKARKSVEKALKKEGIDDLYKTVSFNYGDSDEFFEVVCPVNKEIRIDVCWKDHLRRYKVYNMTKHPNVVEYTCSTTEEVGDVVVDILTK